MAVESTVNQLFTSPIGGAVYFPPGKYLFSGSPQPTPAGSAFISIAALGGSAAAPSQFGVIGAGQADVTLLFACRAGGLINIRGQTGARSAQRRGNRIGRPRVAQALRLGAGTRSISHEIPCSRARPGPLTRTAMPRDVALTAAPQVRASPCAWPT